VEQLLSKGKAAARTLTHARILLKADEGVAGPRWTDDEIAEALEVNRSTWNAFACGVSKREWRLHCGRVFRANFGCASWAGHRRHIWSAWRAASLPLGAGAGQCVCWPTNWWNWRSWRTSRMRPCGARSKNSVQCLPHCFVRNAIDDLEFYELVGQQVQ
jgi:hypothetical protein